MTPAPSRRNSRRTPTNPTTSNTPPDHVGLLIASVCLIVLSWGGLYLLISNRLPRIGGELWLFFVLLLVATSSTTLPLVRYLNVRLTPLDMEVPPAGIIVRQSVWIGLWVVTCAWLQIPRILTLPIAIFIGIVLIVMEAILRNREFAYEQSLQ